MFFASEVFEQDQLTPESVCRYLSLPRFEYAKAMVDWHTELSKIKQHEAKITEKDILDLLENSTLETGMISRKLVGTSSNREVINLLNSMADSGKISWYRAGSRKLWHINRSRTIIVPTTKDSILKKFL